MDNIPTRTHNMRKMSVREVELLEELKQNGITRKLYLSRLKKGWSEEKARTKSTKRMPALDPVVFRAEQNGINRNTLNGRLERGWSVMDAVTIPVQKRKK